VHEGEWTNTYPPYWRNPGFPLTDMDSVGCVYLIPAAVYRSGARYIATDGYTEHYAVCQHARAEGRRVGCLVTHTAAHAYLDEYQMIAWPPLRPTYSMTGNGTVRGSSYTFPLVDNGDCWPHWRYHTETETLDWLRQHVASDWNCVDVGAHVGMYTAWLADHCAHVVAVEPHRPAVQMLIDTLRYNNLHARIVPKAIAAEPGQKAANLCLAGDLESTAGEWTFTTIDEVCADMARVDLVKIDVDGYDYAALQGAQQTIQQHRPAIIVECRDKSLTLFGASVADIAAYLKECGYTWHVADERNWIAVCSDA
jgi:FkbM family methyltransferase